MRLLPVSISNRFVKSLYFLRLVFLWVDNCYMLHSSCLNVACNFVVFAVYLYQVSSFFFFICNSVLSHALSYFSSKSVTLLDYEFYTNGDFFIHCSRYFCHKNRNFWDDDSIHLTVVDIFKLPVLSQRARLFFFI